MGRGGRSDRGDLTLHWSHCIRQHPASPSAQLVLGGPAEQKSQEAASLRSKHTWRSNCVHETVEGTYRDAVVSIKPRYARHSLWRDENSTLHKKNGRCRVADQ